MKASILFIALIFFAGGCEEKNSPELVQNCDLGGEILEVNNEVGMLVYTDSLPPLKMPTAYYFIDESFAGGIYLPLEVCNVPKEMFSSLDIGDSVKVRFSGRIEVLPPTVDASSTRIELNDISLLEPKSH